MSELTKPVVSGPKPFVFVLMPFSEEFDDVYKLGIKPAAEAAGAYAERVDEQIHTGSIYQRIVNQIAKADIIVADMTGRNPNVYYEVGYAHAIGKRVFLLTQNAEDIPFDLRDYFHIVYRGKIDKLKTDLTRSLGWAVKNPESPATPNASCPFELTVNGLVVPETAQRDLLSIPFKKQIASNRVTKHRGEIEFRNLVTSRVTIDRVSWLTTSGSAPVPVKGVFPDKPTMVRPELVYAGRQYVYRHLLHKDALTIPAFGVEIVKFLIEAEIGLPNLSPVCMEVLAIDRAFRFEFLCVT